MSDPEETAALENQIIEATLALVEDHGYSPSEVMQLVDDAGAT